MSFARTSLHPSRRIGSSASDNSSGRKEIACLQRRQHTSVDRIAAPDICDGFSVVLGVLVLRDPEIHGSRSSGSHDAEQYCWPCIA
jgi:hypothetical protein